MTREETLEAGREATAEMPAMTRAFAELKTAIFEKWCASDVADSDGRERLYMTFVAADKARGLMLKAVNNSKLTAADLEHTDNGR